MRASVDAAFVTFSEHFEGVVRTPYLDILGLVTVAIGDLIDPVESALSLPFMVRGTSTSATREQIAAAWNALKNPAAPHTRGEIAHYGWRYAAQVPGNNIELSDEGVQEVVARKLAEIARDLVRRFPDFDEWPADAQLATFSMSWACGAGFRFQKLAAALLGRDFDTASKECHIDTDGPDHLPNTADDNEGVKPRNAANVVLYANAAKVLAYHLDPEQLFYPSALGSDPPPTAEQSEKDSPVLHPLPDDVA